MDRLTNEQRLQIVELYYQNSCSVRNVHRALRPIYGLHNRPSEQSIRKIVTKFRTKFTLLDIKPPTRLRTVRSEENIAAVSASVTEDREMSIRSRSQQLGLCYSTTRKILREDLTSASPKPKDERNIEIKARVGSDLNFEDKVNIAKKLTSSEGELLIQKDVFFNSQTGRLKLRYTENEKAQLVYYDRPDIAGPKLSKFNTTFIDEPEVLEKILTASNGAKGILKKHRYLFMYKNTRIHMDKVDGLGNFMEFEVCLKPEQTIEEGQAFAEELMKTFEIKNEDLMTGAYFDFK